MFNACSSSNEPSDSGGGTTPSTFKNSFNSMAEFLTWAEDHPGSLKVMEDLEVKDEVSENEWDEFLLKTTVNHYDYDHYVVDTSL